MTHFDIVFVADVRFEGGTSTAIALEMKCAARMGLRIGLLMVKGPLLGLPFPVHPHIRAILDSGLAERLDPDVRISATLVIIHHPTIMENRPTRPIRIRSDRVVVVLHHPCYDRKYAVQYDLPRIVRNCFDAFGSEIHLAPVSSVVRNSLPRTLPPHANATEADWENLLDLDDWQQRPPRNVSTPVVIGRHSRPDALKWPNTRQTALLAYPSDGSKYRVRVLGAGDYLQKLYGDLPSNWELLPFSWDGTSDFLRSLDFYVYYHSDDWSEAFGRTVLEAMAIGLVVILPPHFEDLFAGAAVYSAPAQVERVIKRFVDDPVAYAEQGARARAHVEMRHMAERYVERLRSFRVTPSVAAACSVFSSLQPLPDRNVLFMSSNGIGIGHLAQQLAIARHLPPTLQAHFATMSYSIRAVIEEGYPAHFFPYHRHIGADVGDWNRVLSEELFDLISHLKPAIFAYDATAVFDGVVRAVATHRNMFSIWVRRPMWREVHRPFLELASKFDAVIEPGELAEDFDTGPTAACRGEVFLVPPVLHVAPSERLPREVARKALDLADSLKVVAIQLGSGANYDMSSVHRTVVDALLRRTDTMVLDIRSPLDIVDPRGVPDHPRLKRLSLFPSFRYSLAFDAAVSAAGYNAFHEQVLGAIPTLFVPNEAEEMDRQLARARWAELTGRGLVLRRNFDLAHSKALVDRLLDPAEQANIIDRCTAIEWTNGSEDIASYIEDHARLVRTDWDITKED
ncbi:hypothetical protein X753_00345 [Mesorhizobium sp. LNJC399B00]|uniref:glycosyltransferase family protein n=1 Tax=unclassified Mesorhizobium TaxID=325217 RepID=UPI0003CE5D89|nr:MULTISPECIES: glycosyltransferase [unclassified Mesorhizobium]ESY08613.1 hypothetical protein X753_00345 [Mesorhizobium sp. LNJC399B00]WJI70605.1 glycosyltransferase [Mesorhizobium sp. C399B]